LRLCGKTLPAAVKFHQNTQNHRRESNARSPSVSPFAPVKILHPRGFEQKQTEWANGRDFQADHWPVFSHSFADFSFGEGGGEVGFAVSKLNLKSPPPAKKNQKSTHFCLAAPPSLRFDRGVIVTFSSENPFA
jgi:hypothetical protein